MMLITMIARLSCNICCFLYPAYASYKALSLSPYNHTHNDPNSNPNGNGPQGSDQVERWLMYWAVVGTWTAIEAVGGWAFTWLPFYSVIKMGVFLYLSLPQSEGSSYIYRTHLAPLFSEHERDIDAFLASLRGRASTALAGGVGWLWETIKSQLNLALPIGQQGGQGSGQGHALDGHQQFASGQQQPPSLQDPASGTAQQIYGFMTRYAGRYGPLALSAISAAASSATSSTTREAHHPTIASQVPETMAMPIPRPNPSPSDPNLRSRTFLQAQQSSSAGAVGVSSARLTPRNGGNLSQRSSDDSINTRGSGSGSGTKLEMSGYEQIDRDDIPAEGYEVRPGMEKRTSSWFASWSGSSPRGKTE